MTSAFDEYSASTLASLMTRIFALILSKQPFERSGTSSRGWEFGLSLQGLWGFEYWALQVAKDMKADYGSQLGDHF